MIRVTLEDDDARALGDGLRNTTRAREVFELAVARARIPLMEAMAAQNALVDRLAATYGFDVERPIQFDRQQKLITQEDPGPAAEARPPATSS